MKFTVNFDDVATGAVADTFSKTIAALRAAATTGYRCRLRALQIGPSDAAPADLNVGLQLQRIDDVSGGGVGTLTAATPVKKDSLSRAAVITGGVNYSAEPTVYGDPLWQIDINRRTGFIKEWLPEDAPVINEDQLLGLLAAPRTAAAANLSGSLEFEEF